MRATAFKIPSYVKTNDGSQIPFHMESDITFAALRELIAEKLHCFPPHLQLRYRLPTDKPNTGTLIRSDEELQFFIERVRANYVHAKLANGKKSNKEPKGGQILFEDVSEQNAKGPPAALGSSKTSTKQASRLFRGHAIY